MAIEEISFLNVSEPKYHIALPEQPAWTGLDIH